MITERGVERFERRAMGSPLRLTVAGADPATAAAAWTSVSALVEEVEEALSRFRESSALTALNRRAGTPEPAPVGRRLARALAAADRASRATGGAFEPRVLDALERLGYPGARLVQVPTATSGIVGQLPRGGVSGTTSIRRTFADGRWLHLDPRSDAAAVAAPVDLGGIGKGLALRWAGRLLARAVAVPGGADGAHTGRERGPAVAAGALLDAGGDLLAIGRSPQGGPWLVGIEDPRGGEDLAVITVADGAVATSSTRIHAWQTSTGDRAHHLVDPRTGEPGGAGLLAVTVAAADPAWAEVRSKTLFLAGAGQIATRARALGLAAWWVTEAGTLEMTPAARVRTAWLAAEA